MQGIPFFHTISRDIGFRTVHPVADRSKTTILRKLRTVMNTYQARGFAVCDVHGDHELECVRESLRPIALNIAPADSHVGDVERSIRTIKERLRSCTHGLPFKRLPGLLVQHMVADAVRCLNQFPWSHGISPTLGPASIVTGVATPDYNCMRIEFGAYVQVFEDNSPSNTLRARSLDAIALTPTGNAQGDYHFLSLATGNRLSRHSWTALPMTDTAIARVEALALQEKQPLVQTSGLVVEWRHDQPIDDSEYDRDYEPPLHDAPGIFDANDYDDIDPDEIHDLLADVHPFAAQHADGAGQGAVLDDDNDDYDDYDDYDDDNADTLALPADEDQADEDQGAHNDNDAAEDQGAHDNDAAEDQGAHDDAADQGAHNDATEATDAADQGAHNDATEATEAQGAHNSPTRPYNL